MLYHTFQEVHQFLALAAKGAGYHYKFVGDPVESGDDPSVFLHVGGQYWDPLMCNATAWQLAKDINATIDFERGSIIHRDVGVVYIVDCQDSYNLALIELAARLASYRKN